MLKAFVGHHLQVFTVLRHRSFRLYWTGNQFHIMGYVLTYFTIGWLAFDLTGSPLDLSFVTLSLAVPSVTLSLVGGAVADRLNPRHVLTVIQSIDAMVVGVLAFLTFTERVELWHLVVGASLMGILFAFDQPNQQALYPRLLPDRRQLSNAVPLLMWAWELNSIAWPAAAGFIIHASGAGTSFLMGAAGYAIMALVLQMLRPRPVPKGNQGNISGNMLEGLRYIWNRPLFRVLIGTCYVNFFLGMSYIFLLPIFAKDVLHVDPRGLGILAAAPAIGASVAIFIVPGLLRRYQSRSLFTVGTIAFGGCLVAFAASPWFIVSLILLAMVGFSGVTYTALTGVTLQALVPDELRGRVMGLYAIIWSLPPLGAAFVAAVANVTGVTWALGGASVLLIVNVLAVNVFSEAFRGLGVVVASDAITSQQDGTAAQSGKQVHC
jgi:MFS family permease